MSLEEFLHFQSAALLACMHVCYNAVSSIGRINCPGWMAANGPGQQRQYVNFSLFCIVLYLSISISLLTPRAFQKRSRPQQLTLCRSLNAEALQLLVKVPMWRLERIRTCNPPVERRQLYQCATTPHNANYMPTGSHLG